MKTRGIVTLVLLALALQGCSTLSRAAPEAVTFAVARIFPTQGNTANGSVIFTVEGNAVRVSGSISGLSPGKHGLHIHEFGDLSSNDGSSAGGHFNPGNLKHGALEAMESHAGDLGNIVADANGTATFSFLDAKLSLSGKNSILGRALVVHETEDDLVTQPTGNSGARIGYGVIGVGNRK